MKFYIESYGCTSNQGGAEDLQRELVKCGHIICNQDEADVIIVNTCAVTEKTERRIKKRLIALPEDRLIIAGCLPPALPDSVNGIKCRVLLGPLDGSSAGTILDALQRDALQQKPLKQDLNICKQDPETAFWARRRGEAGEPCEAGAHQQHPGHRERGIGQVNDAMPQMPQTLQMSQMPKSLCRAVNISEGCNGSCTYCIVRRARGCLKSRSLEEIAENVRARVLEGAAEIQLSAQDLAGYGTDTGSSLGMLLERLMEIKGDHRLRLGMMNPDSAWLIRHELLEAFRNPRIYRFLHIPVQSGSDRVLKSMGRRYTGADFQRLADLFRSAYPDITIITDVIVGFPGETDEDFSQTMKIIERLEPDKVNVTRFSARPGTPAFRLYDMPDRIKKDRSRELSRLWMQIAIEKNCRYLGRLLDVRVTEEGRDGSMKARADNYLGVVIRGRPVLGSSLQVLIEKSNAFYVTGSAAGG